MDRLGITPGMDITQMKKKWKKYKISCHPNRKANRDKIRAGTLTEAELMEKYAYGYEAAEYLKLEVSDDRTDAEKKADDEYYASANPDAKWLELLELRF